MHIFSKRKNKSISYCLFVVVLLIFITSKHSNQISNPTIVITQTTHPPSYNLNTEAYFVELIGHFQEGSGSVYDVVADDNYAYISDTEQGLVIVNTTDILNLAKTGNSSSGGLPEGIDIQGGYGFIADKPQGLEIHDISNKSNPQQIAVFKEGSGETFGVKVVDDYAYLANGFDGLEIIDISNKTNPQKIGEYDPGGHISSVTVVGNYTFICGLGANVVIVNTTIKTNPQQITSVSLHSNPLDVFVEEDYMYITYFDDYIAILSISNIESPQVVADIDIGGQMQQSALHGDYLCVAGNVGLRFYNIANKSNPIHEGTYNSGAGGQNGVIVRNGLIYIADADDGLEIVGHDSDNDDLADYLELNVYFTNPNLPDSDGDGLEDGEEIDYGTIPNDWDSDDDLLDDYWEVTYGTDPNSPDANIDEEPDGLTNAEERDTGTDPFDNDTDSDGLSDGDEVNVYGTNATDPDSDNDGYYDGFEVDHGSDPLDSKSIPRNLTTWYVIGGVGGFFVLALIVIFLSMTIKNRRAKKRGLSWIAEDEFEEYIEPLAFEEQETRIGIVEDMKELIIPPEPVKRDVTVSYLTELLKVRSIIIMEKNGVPVFARNFTVDMDSALAAGFLAAINNFGDELITEGKKRPNQFTQLGREGGFFWIFTGHYVHLVLLFETEAHKDFKKPLWDFLKKFEIFYKTELEEFSGRVSDFENANELLEMELKINYLYEIQIDVDKMEELELDEKSLVPVLEYYIENYNKDVKFSIVELIDRTFKILKHMNHDEILEQIIFFVEDDILRAVPEQFEE